MKVINHNKINKAKNLRKRPNKLEKPMSNSTLI